MKLKLGHGTIGPVLLAIMLVSFASCKKKEANPLRLAVASNVKFAIEDIARAFTEETGYPVEVSSGSSGKLTAQIESGAPFHLFLAANMKYPEKLLESRFAKGEIRVYAMGSLTVCTSSPSLRVESWRDLLTDAKVRKIAIANPDNAPYGARSIKVFETLGVQREIKGKIVTGENIAQALQFAIAGGADLAFTAKSLIMAPDMKGKVTCTDVERDLYSPIKQGVVILTLGETEQAEASHAFYDYLISEKAKQVFGAYGYDLP